MKFSYTCINDLYRLNEAVVVEHSSYKECVGKIIKGFLIDKTYSNYKANIKGKWFLFEDLNGHNKKHYSQETISLGNWILNAPDNLKLDDVPVSKIHKVYLLGCPLREKFLNERT